MAAFGAKHAGFQNSFRRHLNQSSQDFEQKGQARWFSKQLQTDGGIVVIASRDTPSTLVFKTASDGSAKRRFVATESKPSTLVFKTASDGPDRRRQGNLQAAKHAGFQNSFRRDVVLYFIDRRESQARWFSKQLQTGPHEQWGR